MNNVIEASEVFAPSYKQPQMMMQLRKIVDSFENEVELDTVITDDGITFEVGVYEAASILGFMGRLKTTSRRELCEMLQYSSGMEAMMSFFNTEKN